MLASSLQSAALLLLQGKLRAFFKARPWRYLFVKDDYIKLASGALQGTSMPSPVQPSALAVHAASPVAATSAAQQSWSSPSVQMLAASSSQSTDTEVHAFQIHDAAWLGGGDTTTQQQLCHAVVFWMGQLTNAGSHSADDNAGNIMSMHSCDRAPNCSHQTACKRACCKQYDTPILAVQNCCMKWMHPISKTANL